MIDNLWWAIRVLSLSVVALVLILFCVFLIKLISIAVIQFNGKKDSK